MPFELIVAITGALVGACVMTGAILDDEPFRIGRLVAFVVGLVLAAGCGTWAWKQATDLREAEDAAAWQTLRDRYGVTEFEFPESELPGSFDTFGLLREGPFVKTEDGPIRTNRVVECKTYADRLRIFCPVKGDPGTYAEIPQREVGR